VDPRHEGPETFSPFDVVGHLIDGEETDWIPRARIISCKGARPPLSNPTIVSATGRETPADLSVPACRVAHYAPHTNLERSALGRLRRRSSICRGASERGACKRSGSCWQPGSCRLRAPAQVARVMAKSTGAEVGP